MKKFCMVMAVAIAAMGMTPVYASGPDTQVDALIQKLVEKGILDKDEAAVLKGRVAYDAKTIQENNMKTGLPDWVQNTKLGGDFRVRLQDELRKVPTSSTQDGKDRVRGRLRARLNLETKINDKAKVVIGIATDGGSNNPRSNNVTFSGSTAGLPNAKPNVILNKAYGQYSFTDHFTVTAGKMDNPIWEPMEFLWDSDITPEGAAAQYSYKLNDNVTFTGLGTFFMLGEFAGSASDPFMYVSQVGANVKLNEKMDAKLVGTYTGYGNIKSGFTATGARPTTPSNSAYTNTPLSATDVNSLKYGYSAPMGALEIGFNDPFGEKLPFYIPRVGVFGEYTENPGPKDNNVAWMSGVYMGNSKVSGFGTWKATAAYKVLEKDGWLDILPDSDFYTGGTDIKGEEAILELGLAKNMSLVFDYYHARRLSSLATSKAPEHVFQTDINWKF